MPIHRFYGNKEDIMLVLVTYDISLTDSSGQKRLRRVAKQCVNYGTRVQNSVFECRIDAAQYTMLKHLLLQEIDPQKDSIRFYSLGNRYAGKVEHFGVQDYVDVSEPLIL